jgi:hypothetical protein
MANISFTETDNMDILEERDLVSILIKEIENQSNSTSIESMGDANGYKKENK